MHKADIEKLEDILTNQNKYKQYLKLREIELSYTPEEKLPKNKMKSDKQDPRTIKAGSNISTVERTVEHLHNDIEYQMLYSIVCNTPKFVNTLNEYEKVIYDYRYKKVDFMIYEWEEIAHVLDNLAQKDEQTVGKTKALRIRNGMLKRLAEKIGYTLM